ncbi:hypothetical protein ACK330_11075 [Aeromonas taiwanensis]|uniref:hypothetical protein n=1 Tax=Aeromonas taiwanensis TaxID=633417 RepID=UPI00398A3269
MRVFVDGEPSGSLPESVKVGFDEVSTIGDAACITTPVVTHHAMSAEDIKAALDEPLDGNE